MDWVIGIDMGGSRIKAVACEANTGRACHQQVEPTFDGHILDGQPAWAASVKRIVATWETEEKQAARAIGLSAPGLAAKDMRSIVSMPGRMAGLEGFDWPRFFERERGVAVINDAHAALLGEVWQGAARGLRDVVMLTLGTGVGGAVWSNGELLRGHRNRAGHLGHLSLDLQGIPDITGMPGGFEDLIGEATLPRRSEGRYTTTQELLAALDLGESGAKAVWEKSVWALGCALASLINVLDPEAIVLGGGIAEAGAVLFEPVRKVLDKVEWRPRGWRVPLLKAELGEWAGAYGAAWNALRMNH